MFDPCQADIFRILWIQQLHKLWIFQCFQHKCTHFCLVFGGTNVQSIVAKTNLQNTTYIQEWEWNISYKVKLEESGTNLLHSDYEAYIWLKARTARLAANRNITLALNFAHTFNFFLTDSQTCSSLFSDLKPWWNFLDKTEKIGVKIFHNENWIHCNYINNANYIIMSV